MKESGQSENSDWLVRWGQEEFVHRFIPSTSIQLLKTECRLRSEFPSSQSRNGNANSSKITILWALKWIVRTGFSVAALQKILFYTILSYSIPYKKPRVLFLKGEYQQWQLKYISFSLFSLVRINGKHSFSH